MSRNTTDHQLERAALTNLKRLRNTETQLLTTQRQGSSAIRLAVVSGYIKHTLNLSDKNYYSSVDIAAPDGANILIGSLANTAFRVSYSSIFPDDPATIRPMDTDNTAWGGVMYYAWLTASIGTDDDDYTAITNLTDLTDNAMPQNRVRIASRVYLRQGLGTVATTEVWMVYQLRMTLGWS